MTKELAAFKRFIVSPTRAAQAAKEPKELWVNARIYLAFVVASMLLFWLKPFDFPDANAPLPRETQNLAFWLKVMLWQPPLEVAWIASVVGLIEWLRKGSLGPRMVAGVAWAAGSVFLIVAYAQKNGGISKPAFAAGVAIVFGLFVPLLRRTEPAERLRLASFLLGMNAIGLLMLAGMAAATLAGSPSLFQGAQIAGGLWMMGAAALGVRELSGLRMPRAFMAVFLSLVFQITIAVSLHLLGVVPKDILKALLYA